VGLVPALSIAGQVAAAGDGPHGGPTVPSITLNVVLGGSVPVAVVVTSLVSDGALQLTEIELLMGAPRAAVGWFASLLHSRIFPIEEWVNPLPVIVTVVPLAKPVLGVTVMDPVRPGAATADPALINIASPVTRNVAAPMVRSLDPTRPDGRRRNAALLPRSFTRSSDKSHPLDTYAIPPRDEGRHERNEPPRSLSAHDI
jgi:hypothetical protein